MFVTPQYSCTCTICFVKLKAHQFCNTEENILTTIYIQGVSQEIISLKRYKQKKTFLFPGILGKLSLKVIFEHIKNKTNKKTNFTVGINYIIYMKLIKLNNLTG